MTYDGDGNRITKTIGSTTNYFQYDDAVNPTGYVQLLQEWTSINGGARNLVNAYVYGPMREMQVLWSQGGATRFYLQDGHGSTRMLVDASGNVKDTYDYDAYGNLVASTGTDYNPFLFAGEQYDSELGLYYNRARYLDVRVGRFWGMDRWEGDQYDPSSLHRFNFVSGDPVNLFDPTGFAETSLAGQQITMLDIGILAAMSILTAAVACNAMHNLGSNACNYQRRRSDDEDRTFYRGTTYLEGLVLIDGMDLDRFISAPNSNKYDFGPGLYMTPQMGVAVYFAGYNAIRTPSNQGPALLKIDIKVSKWTALMEMGAKEGPILNFNEIPGATQAFVPPMLIPEFVANARILEIPFPKPMF